MLQKGVFCVHKSGFLMPGHIYIYIYIYTFTFGIKLNFLSLHIGRDNEEIAKTNLRKKEE